MSINYTPILLNKQPGFYKIEQNAINIQLQDSNYIFSSEIYGYRLKIINAYNNEELFFIDQTYGSAFHPEAIKEISFQLTNEQKELLEVNEYYRAQVAYLDYWMNAGQYSNTAIFKSVQLPENINFSIDDNFKCVFSFPANKNTEQISEVIISIRDSGTNEILEKSNVLYPSFGSNDFIYEASYYTNNISPVKTDKDTYTHFDINLICQVDYITLDNYKGKVTILKPLSTLNKESLKAEDLIASNNLVIDEENGCVKILNYLEAGDCLYRTENYSRFPLVIDWEKIYTQPGGPSYFEDVNLESGKKYSYLIVRKNSKEIIENISINYEHSFLSDGEMDFKIKYNPKMSSFKQVVQEAKINTIGSQFPFFFRNGSVKYCEFPLGGLISYIPSIEDKITYIQRGENPFSTEYRLHHSENIEDGTYNVNFNNSIGQSQYSPVGRSVISFLTEEEYIELNKQIIETDLTPENIFREKEYKIKILNWLNNGKPKVFRSPTEGNFIVQLSNVSLAPEEKLGRMLHSFSCTATEIAEYNLKNLKAYGIIKEA